MEIRQPETDYMKAIHNKKRNEELNKIRKMPGITIIDSFEFNSEIERVKGILDAIIEAAGDIPLTDEDFQILMKSINEKRNK